MRTWLAQHGVPDSDADMFMGHKGSGSHTGARYVHRKAEYLVSVTKALEERFAALSPLLDKPLAGHVKPQLGGSAPARAARGPTARGRLR